MTFQTELSRWEALPQNQTVSSKELGVLLALAETVSPEEVLDDTLWRRLHAALVEHAFLGSRQDIKALAKKEVEQARMRAEVGEIPKNPAHFVALFVEHKAVTMNYSGVLRVAGQECSKDDVQNHLYLFCARHNKNDKESFRAFDLWQTSEKRRLLKEAYDRVAFDRSSNEGWSELEKFVEVLVAETEDKNETLRLRRGATVALAQFVWRVKNHMREHWQHQCHLMPIFYGPTGSGKTTAIKRLLEPLVDMHFDVGFDMLEDGSKSYDMSTMPVMVFEEMAGASKSDVNKIKAIMHAKSRQMRQAYHQATVRTMMSTFIGCSNKDVSVTIMDETSNRRFFQINVLGSDPKAIQSIDALKLWRCIDEDAEAPMYANAEDLEIITSIQSTQRHIGPVESWLLDDPPPASKAMKATEIFNQYFRLWCDQNDPTAARHLNATKLGNELKRLVDTTGWKQKIGVRFVHGSNTYTFHSDASAERQEQPVLRLADRQRANI